MKARPILFTAAMIRALLEDRKTQTRRLTSNTTLHAQCPHGQPGDLLWCRETWAWPGEEAIIYRADPEADALVERWKVNKNFPQVKWKPSIFMPRTASRLTLRITEARVQRLQDISAEDAIAEGLASISKDNGKTIKFGISDRDGLPGNDDIGWPWHDWHIDPRQAYRRLWIYINGAASWDANPWVWTISFAVIQQNVDDVLKAGA